MTSVNDYAEFADLESFVKYNLTRGGMVLLIKHTRSKKLAEYMVENKRDSNTQKYTKDFLDRRPHAIELAREQLEDEARKVLKYPNLDMFNPEETRVVKRPNNLLCNIMWFCIQK